MQKNDQELVVQVATVVSRRRRWTARLFYGLAGVFAVLTAAMYTPGHALTSSGVSTFLSDSTMIVFAVLWYLVAVLCFAGVVSHRGRRMAAPALTGMLAVWVSVYFTQWIWGEGIITIASVKNYLFMWVASFCAVSALADEKEP
jgi:hypothetical protein